MTHPETPNIPVSHTDAADAVRAFTAHASKIIRCATAGISEWHLVDVLRALDRASTIAWAIHPEFPGAHLVATMPAGPTYAFEIPLPADLQPAGQRGERLRHEARYGPLQAVAVARPGRDDINIGPFWYKHEAEAWVSHFAMAKASTAMVPGTTWGIVPYIDTLVYDIDPSQVPTSVNGLVAALYKEALTEPKVYGEDAFPDLYVQLCCTLGVDRARAMWDAACTFMDQSEATREDDPEDDPAGVPADAVARYVTAAGQNLYTTPDGEMQARSGVVTAYRFHCLGCGHRSGPRAAGTTASEANKHAGECRRVPLPGQTLWPET